MGKTTATKLARGETLTIGELRRMIATAAKRGGHSRLNKRFTIERVCEIYTAALEGRDEAEVPRAWRTDPYTGRTKPSRDASTSPTS